MRTVALRTPRAVQLVARVRGAAGRSVPAADRDSRARDLLSFARLAAIAVASALLWSAHDQRSAVRLSLAILAAFVTFARALRPGGRATALADAAFAAGVLAATGGVASHLVPYSLVVAVDAGFVLGASGGGIAGAAMAAVTLPSVGSLTHADRMSPYVVATWFVLYPLVGLAGGLSSKIWADGSMRRRMVGDANRALLQLERLARWMPAGLDLTGIAIETVAEARKRTRAPGAAFVQAGASGVAVTVADGFDDATDLVATAERALRTGRPDVAGDPDACRLVVPIARGGETLAVVVARCVRHEHASDLATLAAVAGEASVAVQNAMLFQKIRELSVDDERQRIARDLHDSVAQSLAHLRLELDFIGRAVGLDDAVRADLSRMSRVAERAAVDVRSAIRGLRGGLRDGLSGALRGYVGDMARHGAPVIRLDADDSVRLPPAVELETFRIAQEALSNAVRHARASEVVVGLERTDRTVRLVVEDDGRGIATDASAGIGLDAMHERAERIGAFLSIERAARGGTRVALDVPLRIRSRT